MDGFCEGDGVGVGVGVGDGDGERRALRRRYLTPVAFRYQVTLLILGRGPRSVTSVSWVVGELARRGVGVPGRASKVVSDALRWEVGRGRVVRVGRGRYEPGVVSRSTLWRMRRRVEEELARGMTAARAGVGGPGGVTGPYGSREWEEWAASASGDELLVGLAAHGRRLIEEAEERRVRGAGGAGEPVGSGRSGGSVQSGGSSGSVQSVGSVRSGGAGWRWEEDGTSI